MYYYLILVAKYRCKVIDHTISERMKEIFKYVSPKYNNPLQEWNHDIYYIHILFKGEPNTELSKFINTYKSTNSRLIKNFFCCKLKAKEGIFLLKKLLSLDYKRSVNKSY
jgi:putative transposase